MRILLIGTVNGKLDEGMRNVATHISKELSAKNTVTCVQLKDFAGIINNLFRSDYVLVCARADKKLYALSAILCRLKPTGIILVQPADATYKKLCQRAGLPVTYYTIAKEDALSIPMVDLKRVVKIPVGINHQKFSPVDTMEQAELKRELGLSESKPVVLHVGHCSNGRRIEKFTQLLEADYERVVITSGMFVDPAIEKKLKDSGVKILSGYIPNIEKYYQAADVYFFPTIDTNYVISIPLSVMEALSCGTPVVAYEALSGLKEIATI